MKFIQPEMMNEIYEKNVQLEKQVEYAVNENVVKNMIQTKLKLDQRFKNTKI